MLCSLNEYYRNTTNMVEDSEVAIDNREFVVTLQPDDHAVSVTLYTADFNTDSLIESFVYAIGYVQSFMLHSVEAGNNAAQADTV